MTSENIAKWGGVAVKAANANGVLPFALTDPSGAGPASVDEANGSTLPDYTNAAAANSFSSRAPPPPPRRRSSPPTATPPTISR